MARAAEVLSDGLTPWHDLDISSSRCATDPAELLEEINLKLPDYSVCAKIRKLLRSQFKRAFELDLEAEIAQRNAELWIIGIDTKQKLLVDVCGNISASDITTINSHGFFDADAGYRANAQVALGLVNKNVDVFLLNTTHFGANPDFIEPIVVHELAHLLEQTGITPQPAYNDDENADAILSSLKTNILTPSMRHNKEWALHLAIGARVILNKGLTNHKSIRAYLEAAVPAYDRSDAIKAKKGW